MKRFAIEGIVDGYWVFDIMWIEPVTLILFENYESYDAALDAAIAEAKRRDDELHVRHLIEQDDILYLKQIKSLMV